MQPSLAWREYHTCFIYTLYIELGLRLQMFNRKPESHTWDLEFKIHGTGVVDLQKRCY